MIVADWLLLLAQLNAHNTEQKEQKKERLRLVASI